MNWFDIVLLVVLVGSTFNGLAKGFIRSIFGLVGFVFGLRLAGAYYPLVAAKLEFLPNQTVASIIGFILIWLAVMAVAILLGTLISKAVSLAGLGLWDRLGGLVLGLLLGAFLCALLLAAMLKYLPIDLSEAIEGSRVATFFLDRLGFLFSLLPGDLGNVPSIQRPAPGIGA